MVKRSIMVLTVALGLVFSLYGTAQAAVRVMYDGNTYGEYDCQIKMAANKQSFQQLCNVFDHECDDYGVYVQMAWVNEWGLNHGANPKSGTRVTPNAGGCGHGKYAPGYSTKTNGPSSYDIVRVITWLCKDVRGATDPCYQGTKQALNY